MSPRNREGATSQPDYVEALIEMMAQTLNFFARPITGALGYESVFDTEKEEIKVYRPDYTKPLDNVNVDRTIVYRAMKGGVIPTHELTISNELIWPDNKILMISYQINDAEGARAGTTFYADTEQLRIEHAKSDSLSKHTRNVNIAFMDAVAFLMNGTFPPPSP